MKMRMECPECYSSALLIMNCLGNCNSSLHCVSVSDQATRCGNLLIKLDWEVRKLMINREEISLP